MKVTVAIDSFKECASSKELAQAINKGIAPFVEEVKTIPISDGGEGAIEIAAEIFKGELKTVKSYNSFGENISEYYFLTSIKGVQTAIIESARFVGIHFSHNRKELAYKGSSYGLGLALNDAISQGVEQVIMTLGGSGTTDGGLGLLQALGAKIWNKDNQLLKAGCENPLLTAKKIEIDQAAQLTKSIKIMVACDVDNPFCGKKGAAWIFGPQKGMTKNQIMHLDKQLKSVCKNMFKKTNLDLSKTAGAGAAGGLGGALALLGAQMQNGFSIFAELSDLETHIKDSDWVITGEGRLDTQSSAGKVPYGVAMLAKKHQVKTILLCGSYEAIPEETLFNGIFSIQHEPVSLKKAMEKPYALKNIEMISHEIFKLIKKAQK